MPHPAPPFDRTVCACPECSAFCTTKPGHLIPWDVLRIAEFLHQEGRTTEPAEVGQYLRASPGAKLTILDKRTGSMSTLAIPTIVPARQPDGRCVFLTAGGRCSIHPVAPFGCAFFDTHMDGPEGAQRSLWGLDAIAASPEYTDLRDTLRRTDCQSRKEEQP